MYIKNMYHYWSMENCTAHLLYIKQLLINKYLTRVSDDKLQLKSLKDLEHLRSVAQNRQTWRKLTTRIREAAEVSPSDEWDEEGPK